ncbi:MAG: hypothetical protein P8N49_04850 [Opitutales bacterium]|nr:hypothetical protein [Opitutales bacterium]
MSTHTTDTTPQSFGISTKLLVGAILGIGGGLIGLATGFQTGDNAPFLGWLWGCSFWLSIAIGMLMLIMIFRIFNSKWSPVVRRQLEHGIAAFPWIGVCFIPLLLVVWFGGDNSGILWSWVNLDSPTMEANAIITVQDDVLHQKKAGYLNVYFFSIRLVCYFAVFCGLSYWLRKVSFAQDKDGNPNWTRLGSKISAAGIPAAALALTFGAFDLFMSLEYQWFSTMYGVWFFASGMRAALAVTIIACLYLKTKSGSGGLKGLYQQAHQYDLACLSLAFTVFWAYISFSQYFLIYSANIPEETFWYSIREINPNTGEISGWFWVSMGLIFGHFFFPFLYLLFYRNKIVGGKLLFIVLWILVFHALDLYWNIIPGREIVPGAFVGYEARGVWGLHLPWGLVTLFGVGCLSAWAVLKSFTSDVAEVIPVRDPRILESIHHHE